MHRVFQATMQRQAEPLAKAREEMAKVPPSLSDLDEQRGSTIMYGRWNRQFNVFGGTQNHVKGYHFEAKRDQHFGTIPPKEAKEP